MSKTDPVGDQRVSDEAFIRNNYPITSSTSGEYGKDRRWNVTVTMSDTQFNGSGSTNSEAWADLRSRLPAPLTVQKVSDEWLKVTYEREVSYGSAIWASMLGELILLRSQSAAAAEEKGREPIKLYEHFVGDVTVCPRCHKAVNSGHVCAKFLAAPAAAVEGEL